MIEMRLVREDEYAVLEPLMIDLAQYHDNDAVPDPAGLRGLLWGPRSCGTAFFLTASGDPVGYAIMSEFGRFSQGTRAMELVHFHVSSVQRGAGLGTQFMAFLEEWTRAEGYDRIVLTAGTERAQLFYDKVGYEKLDPATRYRKALS